MGKLYLDPGPWLRKHAAPSTSWEKELASYKDPTTLPHTKTDCTNTHEVIPGVVVCDTWGTYLQWLYVGPTLIVTCPTPKDLQDACEDCLRSAAVAGTLALFIELIATGGIGGGSSAATAFTADLLQCLQAKLGNDVSVRIDWRSHWGDWEKV